LPLIAVRESPDQEAPRWSPKHGIRRNDRRVAEGMASLVLIEHFGMFACMPAGPLWQSPADHVRLAS